MTASDAAAIVAAGGIAPILSDGLSDVDVMTARTYAHPALGGRPVVRLVPRTLGPAEDQVAGFLGLARVAEPTRVGTGQQRALGFPGWALVHDPANGRHALAMVKELEGLARLAKSKPGNAEDGYLRLASTLDAAVPRFLPTFWEQAGRAYIAAENPKQAAACFGRAREAERVHALAVDESRLAQVHLEFALQGSLTAKALSQYGHELAERHSPAEAYQQFASVARQRIGGGLPPHAGLAADLKRLARAAGLKPDVELERFIVDILPMPSVVKAGIGFWMPFLMPLKRLVSTDPSVRVRLLTIIPDPPGWRKEISSEWLGFLTAVGVLRTLVDLDDSSASASEWLGRVAQHRLRRSFMRSRSAVLLEVVAELAPRLRAEGVPLALFGDRSGAVELDLLDLCLHEDLRVAPPGWRRGVQLERWLDDASPGGRDLVAVAGDAQFAPLLRDDIVGRLDRRGPPAHGEEVPPLSPTALADLVRVAGIRRALSDWLIDSANAAAEATIVTLTQVLRELHPLRSGPGMGLAPQAARRLAATDPGAVLGRTLRAGLVGEYGWSAYEEAVTQLTGRVRTDVCWPYIVVRDEARAVVVGPEGVVAEHDFQLAARTAPPIAPRRIDQASYVDGQLFVVFRTKDDLRAYWSGRPDDVFAFRNPDDSRSLYGPRHRAPSLVQVDGGATTGYGPWRVGDHRAPPRRPVAADGTGTWRCELIPGRGWPTWLWREYNPSTGAGGRISTPAFLDVAGLVPHWCEVNAAPPIFASSPLGYAHGLVGWRVRAEAERTWRGEGIDGRAVTWRPAREHLGHLLAGALTLPGHAHAPDNAGSPAAQDRGIRAVTVDRGWVVIWTADATQPASRLEVGSACPPIELWHAMTPRDEVGSAALRTVTDATATRLVAALHGVPEQDRLARARAAVAEQLPAVSDQVLRGHIADQVWQAARCADALAGIRDVVGEVAAVPPVPRELVRHGAFSVFRPGLTGEVLATVLAQIRAAGEALAGGKPDPAAFTEASHDVDWPAALTALPALLYRAMSPVTDVDERESIVSLLEAVAETGLVYTTTGTVRLARAKRTSNADGPVRHPPGSVLRTGSHQFGIVLSCIPGRTTHVGERTDRIQFLERSVNGEFDSVEDYTVVEDLRFANGDPAHLAALVGRVRRDGPLPWRPELVDRLAESAPMTPAEAALILAGLPDITSSGKGGLAARTRRLLGLAAKDANAARESLLGQPPATLRALLGAASTVDGERLWREGPNVDRIAEVWRNLAGSAASDATGARLLQLPHVRGSGLPVAELATPQRHSWLSATRLGQGHRLEALTVALLWLAYELPANHRVRVGLPGAYRRVRQILADPSFVVNGWGPPADPGLAALRLASHDPYMSRYELRPQLLTGPDDPALRLICRPDVELLFAPSAEALMASIEADAPARGDWPQDPRASAPDLVTAVSHRYGFGIDAAAYYLQLLALPDPSDANVMRWNGWADAEFRDVRATVAATPLVLPARRERAGRNLFLPGGWLPQREPNLPLERWKAGLLRLRDDGSPVLDVILVDRPVRDLFRSAWQRVLSGDEPRYATLGGGPGGTG